MIEFEGEQAIDPLSPASMALDGPRPGDQEEAIASDNAALAGSDSLLSQFRQALARGTRLLSSSEPDKARLFKRGFGLISRMAEVKAARPVAVFLTVVFLLSAFSPSLLSSGLASDALPPSGEILSGDAPSGVPDDFQLGAASANLTVTTSTSKIYVWTEEYAIKVDYSTSYIDYKICPYFCTDFIRYRRVNPQYSGDGTYDSTKTEIDPSMTISSWGQSGSKVWFMESCAEFSLNQTFTIFRDYFELDVTYKPGTKNVITTYFFGLYSSSGSLYSLVDVNAGRYNRYMPGYSETLPDSNGMGGFYPSFQMYAPACDIRANNRNIGVEWGYNETVAYLYSPIWMKDCGTGGPSVFSLKYFSMNSVVPNFAYNTPKTFHMFVRPYRFTDGNQRGYDVGYAQWVAPKIASYWGCHDTAIFPLAMMGLGSYSTSFRTWLESSQIALATYTQNSDQINWNYKSSQLAGLTPDDPASVPTSWQLYKSAGTPLTLSDGSVVCNPVSGPYTTANTYRWQLIKNDPYMSWWTGTRGVFWDEMNLWTADNKLKSDYQLRSDFLYDGYLRLIKESYDSGYWDYVIANPFSGLLHFSIAADVCLIEGYEASSNYGTALTSHVWSTMRFVNNIPQAYRPNLLVYQNYVASNSNDQEDVYSALLGAAKYQFHVTLVSYDSYDSQMHNLVMAESMFKAMGCTRHSDVRTVTVDTLDLASSTYLTTSAQMVVMKGGAKATITETSNLASFTITNLHATSNDFDLRVPGGGYFTPGLGAQTISAMTYTPDGYAKFSGRVDAEKTATLTRNDNIQVHQSVSGSASVSLASIGPSADLTVQSTGGTTEIVLKGFTPGKTYKILVNSVVVDQKTATSDGSIDFSRTYGSNDRVQTQLASTADTFPPHVSSIAPANGAASIAVTTQVRVSFNESMERTSTQGAFSLTGPSQVSGSFAWESGDTVMVFTPTQALQYSTAYNVQVGASAKDTAGNNLSPSFSSGFVTAQQTQVIVAPSAPQGLTATGGARSVSLSWLAPSSYGGAPITAYLVYRGTSSNGQSSTPIASLGNVTSYQDAGLSDGTAYYYKVSAVNSAGEGSKSSEAQATTFSVPSSPGGPTAVGAYRSISLSWTAPSSNGGTAITGYRLYRGASSQSLSLLTNLGNVLSFTDAGLADGATYYYKVSAMNAIGEGLSSSLAFATTSSIVPGQPTDVSAEGYADGISLAWTAPASDGGSAITGYKVYRGSGTGQLSLLTTLGNVLSYDDSDLPDNATYYYQISAVNSVGEGARSLEVQGTTSISLPSAPLALLATGLDGKVLLSWDAPAVDGGSPVQTYKVYRAIGLGQMETVAVIEPTLSYLDTGLTNGVAYRYQVSAANSAGEGSPSSEASAIPLGVPGVPLNLQVLPSSSKAALSWASPSDLGGTSITGYRVYRGDSPTSMSVLTTLAPLTNFDDEPVINGQMYYYAVAAINAAGEGAATSPVSCVPGYVPSSPVSLSALPSDGRVSLSWSAPLSDNGHPIIGYNVYRGLSSDNLALLGSLSQVLAFDDMSVANGVPYYYRVTAVNLMGEGAFSALASAKPATLPGIPIQLVATSGVGAIDLVWSAPASDGGDAISSYAIYRGTSLDTLARVGNAASTGYHDPSLPPSTLYYYAISAVNSIGQGPAALASARTAGLPYIPEGLTGSASETSAQLNWEAPGQDGGSSVVAYNLYRGLSIRTMSLVATVEEIAFEDVGLSPGTAYIYSVSAINAVGEGPRSATFEVTTLISVPSEPQNLSAHSGSLRIELAWEAPSSNGGSSVVAYHVYRGSTPAQVVYLAATTLTTYSDSEVSPGQTYFYRVRALNSLGEGASSSEVSSKAVALPSSPVGVQGNKGKSSVSVSWNAPQSDGGAAVSGYVIYRGSNPGSLSKLDTVGAILQYNDSSLPKANVVYYRVAAINSAGEGPQSDIISVALTKKASPPRNLQVSSQDGRLMLSWDAPEDNGGANITSYAIYRRSADGDFARVAMVNSTSLLDMGLTNGVTYSYSIAAINTVGEGNLTGSVSGKPIGLPSSPPYLNATPYDQMVLLRWDSPSYDGGDAVIGYDIFMVNGNEERYLGQVAEDVNSYVCSGLVNGVSYVFRVAAVNGAGGGEKCSVVGKPESPVMPPVGETGGIELGGSVLMVSALGALALIGIGIGAWRTRASSNRRKAAQAASAKRDTTVRVQVAQARVIKTTPKPAISARPEDASFERTVRDLETANRIL